MGVIHDPIERRVIFCDASLAPSAPDRRRAEAGELFFPYETHGF